jgi:hypothetical protein
MMDNEQLGSVISREITESLNHFDTEYTQDRIDALDYYLGRPLGNEVEGRSSVISTEVADVVEQIMPSMMRIFTGTDKVVRFAPRTEEDVEKAEQATDYVNFVLQNDNDYYRILYNFIKDSLLFKIGVIKVCWDETDEVQQETYEGLEESELALLLANPDVEVVEQNENIVVAGDEELGIEQVISYDITLRTKTKSGRVRVENVPPEEFLVSRRAKSLQDARFVCHRTTMTVSQLVSMGYDQDEVEAYAGVGELDVEHERRKRFEDLDAQQDYDYADPSQREVPVYESIIKVDYDEDGVAEHRRVLSIGDSGEYVLENDIIDYIPFAVVSPILMPHRLIGRSIFDLTKDLQVIKSTLLRQYLDSTYLSVMPRIVAVEGQVNLDDLLDGTAGGIIRARNPGAVQPLNTGGIGAEIQPLMRYLDEIKEQRTGQSKASMGLDANALQSTTAAAVAATVKGAGQKLESYARTIAETGMKDVYKLVLKIVSTYQQQPRIMRLRNKFVPIDPREFEGFDLVVNVGLGTMDEQEKMARLMEIIVKQEQILQQLGVNNPIVSVEQYTNTLRQYVELAGMKDASRYFKDPMQAQMEQQQMASQQQQQPSPEMMKLQQDFELKKAKLDAEIALEREKMMLELDLRRQELQAESQLRAAKAITDAEISTNLPRA